MPSSLLHSSARVLEFESLRDLIRGYTWSPLGQERIAELSPSVDRQWIEKQHQFTNEIREFRRVGGRFEFTGLLEISTTVEKARIQGAVLETTEIRDVVLVVARASEWRGIALNPPAAMKVPWTTVAERSSGIIDFNELLRHFRNKIQPDGTLDDRASAELTRIRREWRNKSAPSRNRCAAICGGWQKAARCRTSCHHSRRALCDPRQDRAERRVNGVVHGASSSGQTVFIEPLGNH